ncbi:hypothetical protein BaRGS_00015211 [Batillaria attramentaria]|uniref:Uncharacterized protein n=1 Tax=Batillaria attramentaria TaxID=370345 RepID=A0ABD0L2F8_9CAEN
MFLLGARARRCEPTMIGEAKHVIIAQALINATEACLGLCPATYVCGGRRRESSGQPNNTAQSASVGAEPRVCESPPSRQFLRHRHPVRLLTPLCVPPLLCQESLSAAPRQEVGLNGSGIDLPSKPP